jgi:chemotaxis protein CheZ
MTIGNPQHLDRIADFLRTQRSEEVSLSDVVALAEITATSLQTFFETMDVAIYRELRDIADYIKAMKTEISALGVNEIRETRIPGAGEELGAIIKAAEKRHQHHYGMRRGGHVRQLRRCRGFQELG